MKAPKDGITADRLRELLHYDPATGVFTRLQTATNASKVGDVAGWVSVHGHRYINLEGQQWRANRLAWLYMTGRWPKQQIDHKNLIRDDDRWENLREATVVQNAANRGKLVTNTSGFKGVSKLPSGRWRVTTSVEDKTRHLGVYDCRAAAHLAYVVGTHKIHGEFARSA